MVEGLAIAAFGLPAILPGRPGVGSDVDGVGICGDSVAIEVAIVLRSCRFPLLRSLELHLTGSQLLIDGKIAGYTGYVGESRVESSSQRGGDRGCIEGVYYLKLKLVQLPHRWIALCANCRALG